MNLIITYGWCRTSYVALRSLKKFGVTVTIADENRIGACQFSKYKDRFFRYPSFLEDEEGFIKELVKIVEQTKCQFLLPSHDETEIIAKYRDRFPVDTIIPIASYEKIHWANDKFKVMETCKELNISIPRTVTYAPGIPDETYPFPAVVKIRSGNSAKGVFYPHQPNEIASLTESCIEKYNLSSDRYPIIHQNYEI